MAGVTDLLNNRRKTIVDALRSGKYGYAGQEQARVDSAPTGSVGAPSGVMPARSVGAGKTGKDPLLDLMTGASFLPGLGDVAGLAADARMYATQPESRTPGNAALTLLGALPFIPSMTVFHGSPHKFDAFDLKKIGTGEGAQAYGHGLYFAESPDVARNYVRAGETGALNSKTKMIADEALRHANGDKSKALQSLDDYARNMSASQRQPYYDALNNFDELISMKGGAFYEVDLPDEAIEKMLDWDAPLSEQPEAVQAFWKNGRGEWAINPSTKAGDAFQSSRVNWLGSQEELSNLMQESGIPGIKYYDGMSRQGGKGTRNFVVFDDKLPKILKRE